MIIANHTFMTVNLSLFRTNTFVQQTEKEFFSPMKYSVTQSSLVIFLLIFCFYFFKRSSFRKVRRKVGNQEITKSSSGKLFRYF